MMPVNRVINPLSHSITDLFRHSSHITGELAGRLAKLIQQLPGKMQQDYRVAMAVFVVSNTVFFNLAHVLAKWVDHRIEKHPEELTKDQQLSKKVVLSLAVGISVAVFNRALAKITHTPLSKAFIAVISTAAIASYILFNKKSTEESADLLNAVGDKEKALEEGLPKESPKKVVIPEDFLKKDEHQAVMKSLKAGQAIAIKKLQEQHQIAIDGLNTDIKELKAEKEKALEEAQGLILGLQSTLSELESKVAAGTKEKETLDPSIAEAQSQLILAQAEVESLTEKVKTLTQELAALKEKSEKQKSANTNHKETIKSLRTENTALLKEKEALLNKNKKLTDDNTQLNLQLKRQK